MTTFGQYFFQIAVTESQSVRPARHRPPASPCLAGGRACARATRLQALEAQLTADRWRAGKPAAISAGILYFLLQEPTAPAHAPR